MPIFGAIGIAGTGMTVNRKWLDAVSDNIANINQVSATDEAAFQARFVIAQEMGGPRDGGVQVKGIAYGSPEGRLVYDPTHPLADDGGYVRLPDIDLGSQMSQLIIAQRAYQSNATVVDRAKEAYTAALQIGRN